MAFSLRRFFVEVRTYENYANIPLRYIYQVFSFRKGETPLTPKSNGAGNMAKFVSVDNFLLNINHVVSITFLDEAKRLIFESEDRADSYVKDFLSREDYEEACNKLQSTLDTINI